MYAFIDDMLMLIDDMFMFLINDWYNIQKRKFNFEK